MSKKSEIIDQLTKEQKFNERVLEAVLKDTSTSYRLFKVIVDETPYYFDNKPKAKMARNAANKLKLMTHVVNRGPDHRLGETNL